MVDIKTFAGKSAKIALKGGLLDVANELCNIAKNIAENEDLGKALVLGVALKMGAYKVHKILDECSKPENINSTKLFESILDEIDGILGGKNE